MLVMMAFGVTTRLTLNSLNRYRTANTVLTVERDYHHWNVTLPSITICPTSNRTDPELVEKYCQWNGIKGQAKLEFFEFIESLANASYDSFDSIKDYSSIEVK